MSDIAEVISRSSLLPVASQSGCQDHRASM